MPPVILAIFIASLNNSSLISDTFLNSQYILTIIHDEIKLVKCFGGNLRNIFHSGGLNILRGDLLMKSPLFVAFSPLLSWVP